MPINDISTQINEAYGIAAKKPEISQADDSVSRPCCPDSNSILRFKYFIPPVGLKNTIGYG
ncbi:MAG: hypothetical protein JW786_01545 [Desulfobacterales bacterium]|nr:hypothetical protein [Desulfobacterales bacterium]